MSKLTVLFVAVAIAVVAVTASQTADKKWDMDTCTFTAGNKTWDLSPLFATNGSYTWQQTMYSWDMSNTYDAAPATANALTFEVQVCGNVVTQHAKCVNPSPANMIAADGSCAALGSADVTAFDVNPYNDGLMLTYYHGDALNHIQHYEARVYFICDPTKFGEPIVAEHMKTFFQWHFKIYTQLAC